MHTFLSIENQLLIDAFFFRFVPQEDTMHRELTVREILKSYAMMRLPRTFNVTDIERVVQDVIEALQVREFMAMLCTYLHRRRDHSEENLPILIHLCNVIIESHMHLHTSYINLLIKHCSVTNTVGPRERQLHRR